MVTNMQPFHEQNGYRFYITFSFELGFSISLDEHGQDVIGSCSDMTDAMDILSLFLSDK